MKMQLLNRLQEGNQGESRAADKRMTNREERKLVDGLLYILIIVYIVHVIIDVVIVTTFRAYGHQQVSIMWLIC